MIALITTYSAAKSNSILFDKMHTDPSLTACRKSPEKHAERPLASFGPGPCILSTTAAVNRFVVTSGVVVHVDVD